jgi:hypothetical protein
MIQKKLAGLQPLEHEPHPASSHYWLLFAPLDIPNAPEAAVTANQVKSELVYPYSYNRTFEAL